MTATTRVLPLGRTRLIATLESQALADRWDSRYGGEWPDLPEAEARITLASIGGPPLDLAWQEELTSTREGEVVAVDWPAARGTFDLARRVGRFAVRDDVRGFGIAIDNVLRVIGSELAWRDGLVLLHAAAVGPADAPWVDLFAGRSNVGKSTLTERLVGQGETAISDDLVFVGGAAALPTPFKGSTEALRLRRNLSPVRSISMLRQAAIPACRRLPAHEAFARVLTAVVRYRPLSLYETDQLAIRVEALVRVCPVTELSLTLQADPRAVLSWV